MIKTNSSDAMSHSMIEGLSSGTSILKDNPVSYALRNFLMPQPYDVVYYCAVVCHDDEPTTLTGKALDALLDAKFGIENMAADNMDDFEKELFHEAIGLIDFLIDEADRAEDCSVDFPLDIILYELSMVYYFCVLRTNIAARFLQKAASKLIACQNAFNEMNRISEIFDMIQSLYEEGEELGMNCPFVLSSFTKLDNEIMSGHARCLLCEKCS